MPLPGFRDVQRTADRRLMDLAIIQAVASALAGVRLRWHELHRVGIPAAAPRPP